MFGLSGVFFFQVIFYTVISGWCSQEREQNQDSKFLRQKQILKISDSHTEMFKKQYYEVFTNTVWATVQNAKHLWVSGIKSDRDFFPFLFFKYRLKSVSQLYIYFCFGF